MEILISTNMYDIGELYKLNSYLDSYAQVGVEVFPLFHSEKYEEELKNILPRLKSRPIAFHGPYYGAEHSAEKGSIEYKRTMKMAEKTLEYCKLLKAGHFVFHHNNCVVLKGKKEKMIETSCKNFRELEEMFHPFNITVVVENAGVMDRGNMLLDMEEFIELCKKEKYKVLIDIGHANANGWNLNYVINELKDSIVAYHLHNNDGVHDSHCRIHDGTIDFSSFIREAKKLTPNANWIIEYSREISDDKEGIKKDIEELIEIREKN